MLVCVCVYIKSRKTTSYFHRTFRITLNSFSTEKSLDSSTARLPLQKIESSLYGVIKTQSRRQNTKAKTDTLKSMTKQKPRYSLSINIECSHITVSSV